MDEEATRSKSSRRWLVIGGLVGLLVVCVAAGWYVFGHRPDDPLPHSVILAVKYPLYYPKPVPDGFFYREGSARVNDSFVVYALENGASTITVTQQAMPLAPPDLSHLPGFLVYPTSIGNGAFGLAGKTPSAIILGPSTLVTLTSSGEATAGDIRDTANNLMAARAN